MNKFWDNLIKPIIDKINANYIVEVSSDTGINTRNILKLFIFLIYDNIKLILDYDNLKV